MPHPISVAEFRERVRRTFEREARRWAVEEDHDAVVDAPLHPPTERAALSDTDAALAWVDAWRTEEARGEIALTWATRTWSRIGSQQVPERATVRGATAIAHIAGTESTWHRFVERITVLRRSVGAGDAASAALHARAGGIAALDDADADRLVAVLAWLAEHPASGRLLREVPVRGIDTKWIESHRGIVEGLHRAATGAIDLGLRSVSPLVRLRILDPALALCGLRDVTAPLEDLAGLRIQPRRVFVVENLTTMLAMPEADGAVVIDGGGHRVHLIARLPWAQRVTYWGDLDSDGFAILHRLRSAGVLARSALMDTETLLAHRDLWGADANPNLAALSTLDTDEQRTLQRLGAEGNVRLEQERIPWDFALPRLDI